LITSDFELFNTNTSGAVMLDLHKADAQIGQQYRQTYKTRKWSWVLQFF